MPSCEKCWAEALRISYGTSEDQSEVYQRLNKAANCTPEQQAGPDAEVCPKCDRKAIHQIVKCCMSCGYENDKDDGNNGPSN